MRRIYDGVISKSSDVVKAPEAVSWSWPVDETIEKYPDPPLMIEKERVCAGDQNTSGSEAAIGDEPTDRPEARDAQEIAQVSSMLRTRLSDDVKNGASFTSVNAIVTTP
jgi:hypothetical protein